MFVNMYKYTKVYEPDSYYYNVKTVKEDIKYVFACLKTDMQTHNI